MFFLMIIGVEVSFIDVILIEAFTGLIKSIVFFIPGALGVQELAFVLIGGYVGLGDSISFAIALGRRGKRDCVWFASGCGLANDI